MARCCGFLFIQGSPKKSSITCLSACVLLDATDAADLVGDFGVVHKALELFTTYANGIDGNEVGGVRTGGPADACDLVQYLEGACNEIVEVGVEGLLLCAGLCHEGGVEGILQSFVVALAHGDGRVEAQFLLEILLHELPCYLLAALYHLLAFVLHGLHGDALVVVVLELEVI